MGAESQLSRGARTLALAGLVLAIAVPAASASTIAVDTTQDGFGANGRCGLRDAIQAAQTDAVSGGCSAGSGADVVTLPAGHYDLTLAGAHEDLNHTGDLDFAAGGGAVTIQGAGSDLATIAGRGMDRVIDVLAGADVTIDGVEITGGQAPDGAPGAEGDDGGGVRNSATLTLRDSLVDDNAAGDGGEGDPGPLPNAPPFSGGDGGSSTGGTGGGGGSGGGIFSTGGLVVDHTRVAGNRAGAGGGGGTAAGAADGNGGPGGNAPNSGGDSRGGPGGLGGAGGGIVATPGLQMSESTVVGNHSGAGGPGGGGGLGGSGFGDKGKSGASFGGAGGQGAGGGGIVAGAGSDVRQSTVTANEAGAGGTGGHAGTGGTTFQATGGQSAGGAGGAGGSGAGLSGSLTATNVTVTANRAGPGGVGGTGGIGGSSGPGVSAPSPGGKGGAGGSAGGGDGLALVNATLAGNRAGAGGAGGAVGTTGGAAGATGAAGVAAAVRGGSLRSSITAANGAAGCSGAAPTDNGGNITFQSGTACPGTVADPGLGPLADNGGATLTMAPAFPGPAIDAGLATGCPATDQRGVARPIGAACDAGAYEAGMTVTTGDAAAVTLDSASLPGALTPTLRTTSFHFEYGTSTAYGSVTPVVQAASSAGTTNVGVTIAGLEPSTTYHYRLVAVNPDSAVAFTGADKTFTTADAPAAPIQQQQQQPSDQGQTPATTPPTTTPPVTTPPPTVPSVRGMAFVADSGAAVVRLDKRGRFKLPGLSFSCPKDASGKCTAKISIAGGASGTLSVAPGKAGTATLKASKKLVAKARKKGYVVLTAKVTFAAPGSTPVSVKKSFVLLKRR